MKVKEILVGIRSVSGALNDFVAAGDPKSNTKRVAPTLSIRL